MNSGARGKRGPMMQQRQNGDHQELLKSAYTEGYFETPRETSLVELARKLDYDNREIVTAMQNALNEYFAEEFE
jgi:hypothetical protein